MIGYSKTAQLGASLKKKSQTQKNKDANSKLDEMYKKKGIDYCELNLSENCLKKEKYSYGEKLKLSYAHRHKRIWYKDKPGLLHSFHETVRACLHCHDMIEHDAKLTNKVFTQLRGTEIIKKGLKK